MLHKTFPGARMAIEAAVADGDVPAAERIVDRLKDKAQTTRSREQDALAWFAKGILEDATRRYAAAEQSLLVAVSIGRELFKSENESLGYIARSLGFVYAHMDRAEAAAEMFLLARNVFLKTMPHLAPEVVSFAARCNIALKLPETALAIVHQELGAPDERKAPMSAAELELYLVRGRAFEDENKPVQALKTYARLTQVLMDDPQARATVARGWVAIARIWKECGDRIAAYFAIDCAVLLEDGAVPLARMQSRLAAQQFGVELTSVMPRVPWRVQRSVGSAVAFASPALGLHFDVTSVALKPLDIVPAQRMDDGRWRLRRATKRMVGELVFADGRAALRGRRMVGHFDVGEEVELATLVREPCAKRVLFGRRDRIVLDGVPEWGAASAFGLFFHASRVGVVASIWAPGATAQPPADDVIQKLLNR